MRILRAVYNRAVTEGLTIDQRPFYQVYTSVAKTAKRGISTSDIAKIMKLDLSTSPSRAFARDIFMFSFYTRGMSLIDIAKLKTDNLKNGVLTYQRSKTSQRISVKWRDEMQVIVNRYHQQDNNYPVDISDKALNVINENIALDKDNVFATIEGIQKTALLLFADYLDAATTIAAQNGGGGGGSSQTSGWGHDKDEDELSWAHRCAMMANKLCRPRKKIGIGR